MSLICNKANRVVGFLHRNLRTGAISCKELAYKALIRPILEYACTVWAKKILFVKTLEDKSVKKGEKVVLTVKAEVKATIIGNPQKQRTVKPREKLVQNLFKLNGFTRIKGFKIKRRMSRMQKTSESD
nr:hypothetical protein BaRGS_029883 [Batillaria attramentaria]